MTDSSKGAEFEGLIARRIGHRVGFQPLEPLPDKGTVFGLSGPMGGGLLLESRVEPKGSFFVTRHAFLYGFQGKLGCVELTTYRWDWALHMRCTGDRSLEKASSSRRRRVADDMNRRSGYKRDRLRQWFGVENMPAKVAGQPSAVVRYLTGSYLELLEVSTLEAFGPPGAPRVIDWTADWETQAFSCRCGWAGEAAQALCCETAGDQKGYACPACGILLFLVEYPPRDTLRLEAISGNQKALRLLVQEANRSG